MQPAKTKPFVTLKLGILARLPRLHIWLRRHSDARLLADLKGKFPSLTEDNYHDYALERDLILDPTHGLVADILVNKARKLGIRVPEKSRSDDNENWEQSR